MLWYRRSVEANKRNVWFTFGMLTTRPMLELAGNGSGKKAVLEGTVEVGTSKNEFFDQVYL